MEIVLFDDNAGIGGFDLEQDGIKKDSHDDIIGSCSIPLNFLVDNCATHDKY